MAKRSSMLPFRVNYMQKIFASQVREGHSVPAHQLPRKSQPSVPPAGWRATGRHVDVRKLPMLLGFYNSYFEQTLRHQERAWNNRSILFNAISTTTTASSTTTTSVRNTSSNDTKSSRRVSPMIENFCRARTAKHQPKHHINPLSRNLSYLCQRYVQLTQG